MSSTLPAFSGSSSESPKGRTTRLRFFLEVAVKIITILLFSFSLIKVDCHGLKIVKSSKRGPASTSSSLPLVKSIRCVLEICEVGQLRTALVSSLYSSANFIHYGLKVPYLSLVNSSRSRLQILFTLYDQLAIIDLRDKDRSWKSSAKRSNIAFGSSLVTRPSFA